MKLDKLAFIKDVQLEKISSTLVSFLVLKLDKLISIKDVQLENISSY